MNILRSACLRLKISAKKKPIDITLLAVYFSVAWYLSQQMQNTEELQTIFHEAVRSFKEEIQIEGVLTDESYGSCYDALLACEAVLQKTQRKELVEAQKALQLPGVVKPMDEFVGFTGAKRPNFQCEL